MTSVFKYRSDYQRDISLLKQGKLYAPTIEKLNDPTEGLLEPQLLDQLKVFGTASQKVIESFEALVEKQSTIGIYSLSTSVSDELLWAHYANSHRGFCIEYDLERLVDLYINDGSSIQFANIMKIDYQLTPPVVTIGDIGHDKSALFMKKLIGTKSKRWEYEDEIRVLFEKDGENFFDYRAIKSVTFGLRAEKELIQNFIETFPIVVDVYVATLSGTYDIGRSKVGRTSHQLPLKIASTEFLVVDDTTPSYSKYADQISHAIEVVRLDPFVVDVFYAGLDDAKMSDRPVIKVNANRNRAVSPWPVKCFYFSVESDGTLKPLEPTVRIN